MKQLPETPTVESAPPELLESGHLWILESVVGAPLRFRLGESGAVEFGDAERVYANGGELPPQYQHAVRHIQRDLDREALRSAVDDPSAIVFFGTAMQYRGVDYDWTRTPSFLGREIWSAKAERFRPPDAVDGIFERLGLQAINPLDQELSVRDFTPEHYSIPQSAWYDGPAAGIVIRDKGGHRARLSNPAVAVDDSAPSQTTADELAARYGSDGRLARLADELRREGRPVTVDHLFERAFESALRELDPRSVRAEGPVETSAFRSELAALAAEFIQNNNV